MIYEISEVAVNIIRGLEPMNIHFALLFLRLSQYCAPFGPGISKD